MMLTGRRLAVFLALINYLACSQKPTTSPTTGVTGAFPEAGEASISPSVAGATATKPGVVSEEADTSPSLDPSRSGGSTAPGDEIPGEIPGVGGDIPTTSKTGPMA